MPIAVENGDFLLLCLGRFATIDSSYEREDSLRGDLGIVIEKVQIALNFNETSVV